MAKFQLTRMSSYANNKLQMCSVTQHQCRRRKMCGKCSQIHPVPLTFCLLQKWHVLIEHTYSWQGWNSIGCPLMLRANYRCVQSLNISVDVAKSCGKCSHITYFWTVTKKRLVITEQFFMAKFSIHCNVIFCWKQTADVFSQSTSVYTSPNVWKMFKHEFITLTCELLQKMTCLPWTIYLWKGLYILGCPLLLRTVYRCIPSLNFSVDDAKCTDNVHKFTMYTHFLSVLMLIEQAKFPHIWMSSYAKNKLQMCSVTEHQSRRHLICGKCSHINSLHSLLDGYKNDVVFTEQSIYGKVSTQ